MKIYVAGHNGLVGSALVRRIESDHVHTWVGRSREELDLFDLPSVREFVRAERPDAIVIAAAHVGGIGANSTFPVEFLADNLKIELNLMEASHETGVRRLLFLGSSCVYPKYASQPIREKELMSGALEDTNAPYALAKIAGVKLVESYRRQYNHDWVSAMPCNLYGENDNFDLSTGHVLPSLIRRFHEAKLSAESAVTLWGSGNPMREFLFADDAADAILFLLENYSDALHINVGSGQEVSIKELALIVARVVGFEGTVFWDRTKPDGTPRKLLDSSRLKQLGWEASTSLTQGIRHTYKWYLDNH